MECVMILKILINDHLLAIFNFCHASNNEKPAGGANQLERNRVKRHIYMKNSYEKMIWSSYISLFGEKNLEIWKK